LSKQIQKPKIKKVKKPSFLDQLKIITNLLCKQTFDKNEIEEIVQKMDIDPNVIYKRIISYFYNYPKVIIYLNNYLNNLYDIGKLFATKDNKIKSLTNLILTFRLIMYVNNISKNKFVFLRANDNQDKNRLKIIEIFKEYNNKVLFKFVNKYELEFCYHLVQLGIITVDEIKRMYSIISGEDGEKLDINVEPIVIKDNNIERGENLEEIGNKKTFPEDIQNFINEMKQKKQTICKNKNCSLFDKTMVILDTNVEKLNEPVDITFIGLNPGTTEAELGYPFCGVSGKKLREKLNELVYLYNIKYLITNSILCSTSNAKEIPEDIPTVANRCSELVKEICAKFPSKLYVLVGSDVCESYGLLKDSKITKISGQLINNNLIPIIHPSSLRNDRMRKIWEESWKKIHKYISDVVIVNNNTTNDQKNIEEDNDNNFSAQKIPSDWTFFDVKRIDNNKIIKIFIDKEGKKHYIEEDFKAPIYLKYKPFNMCKMVDGDFDAVCYVDDMTRAWVGKLLREKMETIKKL